MLPPDDGCVHFNGFFAVAVVKLTRYLPNCIKVAE
jgi:hypothetical protein